MKLMKQSWVKTMALVLISATISLSPFGIDRIHASGATLPTAQASATSVRENVITQGMKYLGTPYEFGSSRSDTSTFDCSDFVRQAYLEGAEIKLPADSRGQGTYVKDNGAYTKKIWSNLKRGDLMFFMSYHGSKPTDYSGIDKSTARITHVGIYLGEGKVLHTYSAASGGVRVDNMEGRHWEYRFLFGGSVLK